MFEHLYEYRDEWKSLRGSPAGIIIRQSIQDMIADLIRQKFKAGLDKKSDHSKVPLELFIHYLVSTFMSVAAWWLDSKKAVAPAEVNDIYRVLITPSLKSNLG